MFTIGVPDYCGFSCNLQAMRLLIFFSVLFLGLHCIGQNQPDVDFLRAEAVITPDFNQQSINGAVRYEVGVIKKTDSIYLNAHIDKLNDLYTSKGINYADDQHKIWITGDFEAGNTYNFDINYEVKPKQTLYFFGDQMWTQGQGKYTSYWLPSLDDMTDKIEFDLSIPLPADYVAISNGVLTDKEDDEGISHWHFDMENPMSSYLVMIAVGKYDKQELNSSSGIPLENYYLKGDEAYIEPTYLPLHERDL